jgi:hypothetical protein
MSPLPEFLNFGEEPFLDLCIRRVFDDMECPGEVPVRLSMRSIVAEHPSMIPRVQLKIDECEVVAKNGTVRVFPNLFADQTVPGGAADDRRFVGNFDRLASLFSHCGHTSIITQMGQNISHLWFLSVGTTRLGEPRKYIDPSGTRAARIE